MYLLRAEKISQMNWKMYSIILAIKDQKALQIFAINEQTILQFLEMKLQTASMQSKSLSSPLQKKMKIFLRSIQEMMIGLSGIQHMIFIRVTGGLSFLLSSPAQYKSGFSTSSLDLSCSDSSDSESDPFESDSSST